MENKDLPEIGFEKKKERKGLLPWLQQRLGFGRSASMGNLPSQGALNIGKIGAQKVGIAAILAGKGAAIATFAVVALAVGTTLYMKGERNIKPEGAAVMGDASKATSYVPAIMRQQSSGSSLDMFKEANKGVVSMDEPQAQPKEGKPVEEKASADENVPQEPGMDEQKAGLQGVNQIGLSSDINGGSNKFSALGGFGNKAGSGAFGNKVGFSNTGNGFANLPKFQDRKNKLLAMSSKKAPVGKGSAVKRGTFGQGAFSQAKGIKSTQKQYLGNNADSVRSTQDLAWEGQTGSGSPQGGQGLGNSDGGAGLVQTPSSINDVGGGGGDPGDYSYPDTTGFDTDNPWGDMLNESMMYLMMAAGLAYAGSWLVKKGKVLAQSGNWFTAALGWAMIIAGWAMCISALLLALKVVMNGIELMSKYKQTMLGTIYLIGGLAGVTSAVLAMCGAANIATGAAAYMQYFAGAAALIAMLGSMASGPAIEKYQKESMKCQQEGGKWDKDKGECKK